MTEAKGSAREEGANVPLRMLANLLMAGPWVAAFNPSSLGALYMRSSPGASVSDRQHPFRHLSRPMPTALLRPSRAHKYPTMTISNPLEGVVDSLERRLAQSTVINNASTVHKAFDGMAVDTALRPKRIILVRHAESKGNRDLNVYSVTPDSQVELTSLGYKQAIMAGHEIRKIIGNESVKFFISPYMRARQTVSFILRAFRGQTVQVSMEPRLREQDFGNFQTPSEMRAHFQERQEFGRFYFRFPNGEAGTDVYDRMASFIAHMFRTMQHPETSKAENYVLITHGLLMRIFCMCYLRWAVPEFEQVWNPDNTEIWMFEKHPEHGTYELAGRWNGTETTGKFQDIRFGTDANQTFSDHMKRPLVQRTVMSGGLDDPETQGLEFLKNLPGTDLSFESIVSASEDDPPPLT